MNAIYTLGFFDRRPAIRFLECDVKIIGESITVSYLDGNNLIVYKGWEEAFGHYLLECPEVTGKATLHRTTPLVQSFEGYWYEEGDEGFWKIHVL